MIGTTETMLQPGWLLVAGAALGFAATALAAYFLMSLRRTSDLERLSDTLEQVRVARDQASRANRANHAKSAFLARMSHELRTPLSTIIGYAELIEQEALGPVGNAKYAGFAGDIRLSGRHLLGIINDILDLSKVEAGHETLREQAFPTEELLDGVRVLLEGQPQEAGVELVFDHPKTLPAIRADKRRLTQILVNLLSNGIRYTPAGGRVTLRCRATGDSGFVFQTIDTGIGMAAEDIPVALSPFGQVDNDSDCPAKGTGLGLPLAKALAELHGGSLDLQSELGQGSTVTLRLPAHRVVTQAASKTRQGDAEGGASAFQGAAD